MTTEYSRAELEFEAAMYAEGTQFKRDDLIHAWNTLGKPDERLQDFFERFLATPPKTLSQGTDT